MLDSVKLSKTKMKEKFCHECEFQFIATFIANEKWSRKMGKARDLSEEN